MRARTKEKNISFNQLSFYKLKYHTLNIGPAELDLRFDTLITPLLLHGRHLTNDNDIKKFQYSVLHALLKLEVGIRQINNHLTKLQNNDDEREPFESAVAGLKELHLIVRMIGSIVPWQLMQNWEITALSQNPPPGFIIGKKGFRAEIQLFREQYGINGDIIILNDLTHCLTVGDAIKLHKDGTAEIIEVKSGKKARLSTIQREKIKNAQSYMEKGLRNSDNLQLTRQWHKVTHNWSQLESLLKKAKTKGFAVKHPQPSITYFGFKPSDKVHQKFEDFMLNDRVVSKYKPLGVSLLSDNISEADKLRGVPPPTIFKISDRNLIRILKGELNVVSFFSPFHPQLTKELMKIGFSLELIDGDKMDNPPTKNWQSLTQRKDGTPQYLACRKQSNNKFILIDHTIRKILYTFETEKSFINSLIQAFDEFSKNEENLPDFKESLSGVWDINFHEQLLRSWDAKLMKRRPTHIGLDEKKI